MSRKPFFSPPRVAPASPPARPSGSALDGRLTELYSGRELTLQVGAVQSNRLVLNRAALLRLDAFFDPASSGFLFSTETCRLRLVAWPESNPPGGSSAALRAIPTYRGTGPFLFLPSAGTWKVEVSHGMAEAPTLAAATLFEGMPVEIAQGYLTSPPPTNSLSGTTVIPANASTPLFGAADLAAANLPQALFGCIFFQFFNTAPAIVVQLRTAIGQQATVTDGMRATSNTGTGRDAVFGRSVSVHNTTGSDTTLYWEGTFI